MSITEWSGKGWRINVTGDEAHLARAEEILTFRGSDSSRLSLRRRWLLLNLYDKDTPLVRLSGIKRGDAASLAIALRRLKFVQAFDDAVEWRSTVIHLLSSRRAAQRWISTEEADELIVKRPELRLIGRVRAAQCAEFFDTDQLAAADFLATDIPALVDEANQQIMAAEPSTANAQPTIPRRPKSRSDRGPCSNTIAAISPSIGWRVTEETIAATNAPASNCPSIAIFTTPTRSEITPLKAPTAPAPKR